MKKMNNNLKSASLFGIWLVIATICLGCIFAGVGNVGFLSSIIMTTFMVMPVRDWFVRILVWAIQYIFSINPTVKKKLSPYFIIDNLDPTGDKKVLDKGVLNIINWIIGGICTFIAIFFLAFQGIAKEAVYTFMHNVSVLFGYFVEGKGFISFLWGIATVVGFVLAVIAILTCMKGKASRREIGFLVYIVIKHIANYFVLKYTIMMVIFDIISIVVFWGALFLAVFLIRKKMRH